MNLKEHAQAYKPTKMKNIAELDKVDMDLMTEKRTLKEGQPDEYVSDVVIIDGADYRVPKSVFAQLQLHLLQKPTLKSFKVIKTGTGIEGTKYTVVPLE